MYMARMPHVLQYWLSLSVIVIVIMWPDWDCSICYETSDAIKTCSNPPILAQTLMRYYRIYSDIVFQKSSTRFSDVACTKWIFSSKVAGPHKARLTQSGSRQSLPSGKGDLKKKNVWNLYITIHLLQSKLTRQRPQVQKQAQSSLSKVPVDLEMHEDCIHCHRLLQLAPAQYLEARISVQAVKYHCL